MSAPKPIGKAFRLGADGGCTFAMFPPTVEFRPDQVH